jgi:hypothetical protein
MPRPLLLPLAAGALLAGALVAGPLPAQSAAPPASPPAPDFLPGPGVELLRSRCTVCHPPAMITAHRMTARQWGDVVDRMIGKGALVSDADYGVILAYLSRVYGVEQPPS